MSEEGLQTADPSSIMLELSTSVRKSRGRVGRPPKQPSGDSANVSTIPEPTLASQFDVTVEDENITDKTVPSGKVLLNINVSESVVIAKDSINKQSPTGQVGDNTGPPSPSVPPSVLEPPPPLPPSQPGDPWHLAFQELKFIRQRVQTLDKIERSTEKHTNQLEGVVHRTAQLETTVKSSSSKIKELSDQVSSLKSVVEEQEKTISSLTNLKEEISQKFISLQTMSEDFSKKSSSIRDLKEEFSQQSASNISEMNELIQQQRDQVESFNDITTNFKQEVRSEMESNKKQISNEIHYHSLKYKASSNKLNLVITGLKEDASKAPLTTAKNFFSSTLKIKDVNLDVAYRLGTAPEEGSTYSRPLVVRFPNMADRDKVWKNKTDITEDDGKVIRIQTDVPKRLRDDSQLLRRVAKAASVMPKYSSARVRDYKLTLNGEEYAPDELEKLPEPIRPSTLATPRSDSAVVFFSRHSIFSNHYQSPFKIKGVQFNNMEQFLAYRRAQLSDKNRLVSKALDAQDPAEAKSILNTLKKDHIQEWLNLAPEIAAEGLREKFKQNQYLFDALIATRGLQIGEASRDSTWGIGMPLNDPQVLDHTKWPKKGNLLGRTLMKIREEFRVRSSPSSSPSKQKTKQNQKI